jgi:hypothetical protein
MNTDLLMFSIGMIMAIGVSCLGMLLAYTSYKKRGGKASSSNQSQTGGAQNG